MGMRLLSCFAWLTACNGQQQHWQEEIGIRKEEMGSHVSAIFKSLHCKMAASGNSNI